MAAQLPARPAHGSLFASAAGAGHDESMGDGLSRVFVIGMGEVGRRLAAVLARGGSEVVAVTRDSGWGRAGSREPGARLVCVREERLGEVLARLEGVGGDSLALIQNGWIRPLLDAFPGATRGLIWFNSKGDFFSVLRPSPFSGPLAAALATVLDAAGIPSDAEDEGAFRRHEAEKMGFNCVVGLPLAVHGVALGEYLDRFADEAEALFTETTTTCAAELGVDADPGWWAGFCATVAPLAETRASAAKALELRSGAVLRLARRSGARVPVTERLLAAAGYVV